MDLNSFEIAAFYNDDSPLFEGIHDTSSFWNGYSSPFFTIDVLKTILSYVNFNEVEFNLIDVQSDDGINYFYQDVNYSDDLIPLIPIVFNGVSYFSIDAINCWKVN